MTTAGVYGDRTPKGTAERRLARLEDRFRNGVMGEEERLELRDEIGRLRRKLETLAETVDAIHSGLESMGE